MNILYINHYAGTPSLGMEYRPYHLSREWVRLGHQVKVLAAGYSHVRTRQPEIGMTPLDESIDGISYRWYPTPRYRGNGIGRARNIWVFLRQVWLEAAALSSEFRPNVVIASSTYPMDIWVARRIARLAGARLVFELHDLWPLSPIELSGMSPRHPFALLCSWAESVAYRDSDVVVSILPKVQDYVASRGLDLDKLHIVQNGISPEDWAIEPEPLGEAVSVVINEAHSLGRIVVGYAGSMGSPNALDTLLGAAASLREKPFQFLLVGDGHERERLERHIATYDIGNVRLLGPIPKTQIPSFLTAIDIAYIGWQRVPIYRFGIAPNKLMDYMMAGCVVLHSVEAGNDPVADANCGLTVAPESPDAVANGLLHLALLPEVARREMGARGRDFVLARHTYPTLARRFLDALGEKP